jgi:hypothetical protein
MTKRFWLALLVVGAALAQQPPNSNYPLNNSSIVNMQGVFQPSHAVMMNPTPAAIAAGSPASPTPVQVPDSCFTLFKLEPGQRAIEARQVSPPTQDEDGSTCHVQLEVGEPPESVLPPMLTAPPPPNVTATGEPLAGSSQNVTADADPSPGVSCGYATGWFADPVTV